MQNQTESTHKTLFWNTGTYKLYGFRLK